MQANLWEITVQLGLFAAWGWFIGALVHTGKYRSLMAFDDPLGHTDTLKHSMYNGRDRESRDTVFGLTHTLLLTGSLQLCCQDAPCFFLIPLGWAIPPGPRACPAPEPGCAGSAATRLGCVKSPGFCAKLLTEMLLSCHISYPDGPKACNEENIQAQTRNGKAFTAFNFRKAFWFIVLTRARAWKWMWKAQSGNWQ